MSLRLAGDSHIDFPNVKLGVSFTVAMHLNLDDAGWDIGWFSYGSYQDPTNGPCGFMCQVRLLICRCFCLLFGTRRLHVLIPDGGALIPPTVPNGVCHVDGEGGKAAAVVMWWVVLFYMFFPRFFAGWWVCLTRCASDRTGCRTSTAAPARRP